LTGEKKVMSRTTKIAGWIVFVISEILIVWGFIISQDVVAIVGYQVAIFTVVWGSVAGKNVIDYKRDYQNFKSSNEGIKNDV
jgi:hypothetical protein